MRSAPQQARPHRFEIPTRAEVARRLTALIQDDSAEARAAAADWAGEYIRFDDPQIYPEIKEPALWEAIGLIASADLISTDRPFLYGPEDFASWQAELLAAPGGDSDTRAPAS